MAFTFNVENDNVENKLLQVKDFSLVHNNNNNTKTFLCHCGVTCIYLVFFSHYNLIHCCQNARFPFTF